MNRTLTVVFDEEEPWHNEYGTFYPVSGLLDGEDIVKANKKTPEAAQQLRETLEQIVGIECDFYLDDKGKASTGRQMWGLKAILDLEGGAIYGKPPQSVGAGASGGTSVARRQAAPTASGSSPAPTSSDKDAEIRAAVALKAAVRYVTKREAPPEAVIDVANDWLEWLESKSSGPVQSSAGLTPSDQPSQGTPAGPDTTSGGEESTATGKGGKFSSSDNPWEGMEVSE